MILTKEIVEAGRSRNGGYGLNQLKILGIFSFKRGWKKRIIGKDFDEKIINNFLFFKNYHLKNH